MRNGKVIGAFGIDLSPLVAVVVLQVLSIVIGSLQGSLLGVAAGALAAA